jgi:hypothetical protein
LYKLWGIFLVILLAACLPSQPTPLVETTTQATAFQTKAVIPTTIPSPAESATSLPFSMPPTWTPPAIPVDNGSSHICRINGAFPDLSCTPGAIFNVTAAQVCVSGYSTSVRDVSESTKNQVFASYGIMTHAPGQYEVDHFISLELGGSNDITNLWPEAASPKPGFHEKDKVENYLHDQVCNGNISLQLAQDTIKEDWVKVYNALGSAVVPIPQNNQTQPTISSAPSGNQTCCKVCSSGKACGDSCISKSKTCTKPPGCACQAK